MLSKTISLFYIFHCVNGLQVSNRLDWYHEIQCKNWGPNWGPRWAGELVHGIADKEQIIGADGGGSQ